MTQSPKRVCRKERLWKAYEERRRLAGDLCLPYDLPGAVSARRNYRGPLALEIYGSWRE
jgi:hypothetical protein